jgi:hypothetical protein
MTYKKDRVGKEGEMKEPHITTRSIGRKGLIYSGALNTTLIFSSLYLVPVKETTASQDSK